MTRETTITIEGMSCGHCVAAVREALAALPGVTVENVGIGSAKLAYDPNQTTIDAIRAAIEDAGYQPLANV